MPRSKPNVPEGWIQRCTDYPPELIAEAERYAKELFPPVDFDWVVRHALAQFLHWSPTAANIAPGEPTGPS